MAHPQHRRHPRRRHRPRDDPRGHREPRVPGADYGPAAMSTTDAPPADLLDPAWWPDLDRVHEFFTWARREAPVYRDANGYWIVTRHADVLDVERRSDVFSSQGSYRANIAARGVEHDRPGRPGAPGAAAAGEPAVHPAGGGPGRGVPRRAGSTSCSTPSPTPASSRWCTTWPPSCRRGSPPTSSGSPRTAGRTSRRGRSGSCAPTRCSATPRRPWG